MQNKPETVEIPIKAIEELCLFLVASAEGLFEEPTEYGPLRLLQAVGKIADLIEAQGTRHPFLAARARDIDENLESVMEDMAAFQAFVSRLVVDFSRHSIPRA
jgi:hypothetical protein